MRFRGDIILRIVPEVDLSILFMRFRRVFPAFKSLSGDSILRGAVQALSRDSLKSMHHQLINLTFRTDASQNPPPT